MSYGDTPGVTQLKIFAWLIGSCVVAFLVAQVTLGIIAKVHADNRDDRTRTQERLRTCAEAGGTYSELGGKPLCVTPARPRETSGG